MKRAPLAAATFGLASAAVWLWWSTVGAQAAPTCTLNFAVAGGGSYFTASNWNDAVSPSTHRVPTSNDYACIPASVTGAVTFSTGASSTLHGLRSQASGGFVVTAGTLTLTDSSNPSTISRVTLNGGTISGAATLQLPGAGTWTKGTLTGTGSTVVPSTASLTLPVSNSGTRVLSRPTTNNGTLSVSPGLGSGVLIGGGVTLTNGASATIDLQGDNASIKATTGGGSITNSGVITRSSGPGTTTIAVPVTSALDGIAVQIGTLSLAGGGALSGTSTVPSGTTLSFDGGSFALTSATFGGAGTTRLGAATWQLTGTTTVNSAFTFNGGTVDGLGSLSLSGVTTWVKGTMTGGGSVTVTDGASMYLTLTITGDRVLSRALENDGLVTVSAGLTSGLLVGAGVSITNSVSGVIDLHGDNANVKATAGGGHLSNVGLVNRSSGGGTSTIALPVTSALAAINVEIGTLSLAGGGSVSGTATVAAGVTLGFDGGTFAVSDATFNAAGTTRLRSATWQLFGATSVNSSFTVDGGTVDGSGSLAIAGATNWIKGTMTGSGPVSVAANTTLALPATNTGNRVLLRSMTNDGTIAVEQGLTGGVHLGNGATLTNDATGVVDLRGDSVSVKATTGNGAIVNSGVVQHTTGTGTATIGVPLTSKLTGVHLGTGTLALTAGGTLSGKGAVPAGTTLTFSGGAFDLTGADLHGAGTVKLTTATWHLKSDGVVRSAFVIDGGTIDGAGALAFDGAGTWVRGTITGNAGATVGVGASLTLPATTTGNRVLSRPLSVTGGQLHIAAGQAAGLLIGGGASIDNTATSVIELQGDRADIKATTGGGTMQNEGTVTHTGTGTATISIGFDNSGEIDVDAGTVAATSTFTAYDTLSKTLTKGVYVIAGVLRFPNAGITSNQASLRLMGAAADIQNTNGVTALSGLSANEDGATLHVVEGRSLAVAPLTNTGTVAVGTSSTVSVGGAYTQTAVGSLDLEIGGTSGSPTAGKVAVANKATLAGTLHLTTSNGFDPAVGQTFTVMTFGSRSGCFTTITGSDLGGGKYLDVTCTATKVTVVVRQATAKWIAFVH